MLEKLSMASSEAPSKPTCSKASVMPRRRPALDSSAVVGTFAALQGAPSASTVPDEWKDKVRSRFFTGNSMVEEETRFFGFSASAITWSGLENGAGDITPEKPVSATEQVN